VVIFQIQQYLSAEIFRDVLVNTGMVGRRVTPHQFHRVPVFLALLGIEREPRQPF
jgi:hypothetical protein